MPWKCFIWIDLPADIFDKVSLAQRLKNSNELDASLRMTRSDLLPETELADSSSLFPDEVKIGSMNVPVQYRFSPGDREDGATVRLPLEGVGQLDDAQAGWLVPGLLESRDRRADSQPSQINSPQSRTGSGNRQTGRQRN